MVVTNVGRSGTTLLISSGSTRPTHISLEGTSGATLASVGSLISTIGIKAFTSTNTTTVNQVKWTGDWDSYTMSGLSLLGFGLQTGSPTGDLWHYENFGTAISFDGTNELRVEITWEIQ